MDVSKSVLESAIDTVLPFSVKTRAIIEAHTMIRIRGEGDKLYITACSQESTAEISFPQNGHDDIDVLVNAARLSEVVSALPGPNLKLKQDDSKPVISISSGKSRVAIASASDTSVFPVIDESSNVSFTANVDDIKTALNRVAFVADPKSMTISQRCILIQTQGDRVLLGAALRQRIAGARFMVEDEILTPHRSLVTYDVLKAVIRALKDYDTVQVSFVNGHVQFKTDDLFIDVLTVAAEFVDITRVESQPNVSVIADIQSEKMVEAVKIVEVATKDDSLTSGAVRLSITSGECKVGGRNAQDEGVAYFDAGIHDATLKEIGCLATWLADAAKGGEQIKLVANSDKPSALIFTADLWFYMMSTMA